MRVGEKMERLQKVIAESGIASRRKAESLIQEGRVRVNGQVVTELGTKVSGSDIVSVDNKQIGKEVKEYYLFYKPRGVVSTSHDDKGRKSVVDFIPTKARIYPVGRLDYDTTGILLLTNDGEFANFMTHPKNEIDKVYIAKIRGILTGKAIYQLEHGVVLDGKKTAPSKVKVRKKDASSGTSIVEITIHEGKNHQVKNMFASVGYDVLKLKRERIGFLHLGNLKSGEYRSLNAKEIKQLYDLANR